MIGDDLGPQEGFDFMGEDGISRGQTPPKLGAAIRQVEDQYVRTGTLHGWIAGLQLQHETEYY